MFATFHCYLTLVEIAAWSCHILVEIYKSTLILLVYQLPSIYMGLVVLNGYPDILVTPYHGAPFSSFSFSGSESDTCFIDYVLDQLFFTTYERF